MESRIIVKRWKEIPETETYPPRIKPYIWEGEL
jgi:hypothetical protein